jgi:hypothetical protein
MDNDWRTDAEKDEDDRRDYLESLHSGRVISSARYWYATTFFGLPENQIKYYDELSAEQKERCHWLFGKTNADQFVYAVKQDGDLVSRRERKRPEWEAIGR